MANASYRIGRRSASQEILEMLQSHRQRTDAFQRCREHLQANGVDLTAARPVTGPWVTWDATQERFVGDFADQANEVSRRLYRKPFVVPELA